MRNILRLSLLLVLVLMASVTVLADPPAQEAPILGADSPNAIPDQFIIAFTDTAELSAQVDAVNTAERFGGTVLFEYTTAFKGFAAILPEKALKALQNDPNVAYIEQDQEVNISGSQSPATWGIDRIDQRDLPLNNIYNYNNTGSGVHVYIIDTGIRKTHNQFGGRAFHGFTAIEDGNGSDDCNGHGTHVAGTVGGSYYGVAKQARLYAVRVLNCSGSGTVSGVIAGVDWVTEHHQIPAVANMSLGGGASELLDEAIQNSIASGVVYVVAAGNHDTNACNYSPARVLEAITVGATNASDERAHHPDCGWETLGSGSNYGYCLDLFAPGTCITSAWHTSDTATNDKSGTSMASPHVAGAAALYLESAPSSTPGQVADAIKDATTTGRLSNIGIGSPNLLLYTWNDAQYVDQDVSTQMLANKWTQVSITMKNTGMTEWRQSETFRLGSQPPGDTTWGRTRVELPREVVKPGENAEFIFQVLPPDIPAVYPFQWRMLQKGVEWFGDVTPEVQVTVEKNDAQFVSQDVPTQMLANKWTQVSITMTNTGTTAWRQSETFRLGSQPQGDTTWGRTRVELPREVVWPGESAEFIFGVIPPDTPDVYDFQWRMIQEQVQWFGDVTPNVQITVEKNDAQFISQNVPPQMPAGEQTQVSITMKNTGTTAWRRSETFRLGSQPPGDTTWGRTRVQLPREVVWPGESAEFIFNVIPPDTPGVYDFQWRMIQEWVQWFGDLTPKVEVAVGDVEPPTAPGPTTSDDCVYTTGDTCFVTGDFTIQAAPATDSGSGVDEDGYQICRSNDTTGWGGCDHVITSNGTTSYPVTGADRPASGKRRAYYFRARDNAGNWGPWNDELYVEMDTTPPSTPGPTYSLDCEYTIGDTCYVSGDFTITVAPATDSGSGVDEDGYQVCRSYDTTGWGGCNHTMTFNATTSYTVTGADLPAPGDRRAYYFRARDNVGNWGAWNDELYVQMIDDSSSS